MNRSIYSSVALGILIILMPFNGALAKENSTNIVAATPVGITAIPKMVDYGSDKCVPCKAMAPILDELRETYEGKVDVQFIDVKKNREEAVSAKIRVIPTQIFFNADGKEVARHEGFLTKDKILEMWREHDMLPPVKK